MNVPLSCFSNLTCIVSKFCKQSTLLSALMMGSSSCAEIPPQATVPSPVEVVKPQVEHTEPTGAVYVVSAEQLEGRSYYRLDDKGWCKANDPKHTKLKSWGNKMSFQGGKLLIWGVVCNDTPKAIPLRDIGQDLLLSKDLKDVFFRQEHLKYSEIPPKLCPEGIWCPENIDGEIHK